MRISKLTMLAASAALVACSSDTSKGSLTFTIAESLFVLEADNPAAGYVLLSSAKGNCAAVQQGLEPVQIGNTNYLLILLTQVDAQSYYVPLTSGTYNILDPSSGTGPAPPALFGYSGIVATDSACNATGANATSGSATLSQLDTSDGGTSLLSYSGVYDGVEVSGSSQLTTCLTSVKTPQADAGTCVACTGPGDGGACTIQL